MKHRIVRGVCLVGALLALGCGGAQTRPSRVNITPGAMPAGGNWDGVFQSPAYGRMEFTVAGDHVTGLYEGERHFGKIEGTINGDVLNFKWTQWNQDLQGKQRSKTGNGYFRYTIEQEQGTRSSHEVQKIVGEWGYGEDNGGNAWDGVSRNESGEVGFTFGAVPERVERAEVAALRLVCPYCRALMPRLRSRLLCEKPLEAPVPSPMLFSAAYCESWSTTACGTW